jgi:aldose 1-epimerase
VIDLAAGRLRAAFAPELGMVGCSLADDGEELLGQRGGLAAYRERGSTFGIPLLYPWANRLAREVSSDLVRRDANGLPIHGLLAAYPRWEVRDRTTDWLAARVDWAADAELMAAFPWPHELDLEVELAEDALTIATIVRATGDEPVPISFGWHPYLTLPGVPRRDCEVALPVRTRAELDERGLPTGRVDPVEVETAPLDDRTYDDMFPELAEPTVFSLVGAGRRVEVEFGEGYPVGQVYAPPGEDYVCFEPMTAPTNALVSGDGLRSLPPGESFRAEFTIRVSA